MTLTHWRPPPLPPRTAMAGRYVGLEPLTPDHARPLHAAFAGHDDLWRFMPMGPFAEPADLAAWIEAVRLLHDPLHFAVVTEAGPCGTMSLMRQNPAAGSIETGWIVFAPVLQRTRSATEAVYLHMEWAFTAGYRRFEWKCDAANLASRRAAQRFGLSYEGVHRQAIVVKGRNRDTAWFAAIDAEWPPLRDAFATWLDPTNFDASGRQRSRLSDLTRPILAAMDRA